MKSIDLFRLTKTGFVSACFDGEGARLYGGRWNSKGSPCVYLGTSRAICVLETLVHLNNEQKLPLFSMLQLTVPEQLVSTLDPSDWPKDWAQDPAPSSTKEMGDSWLSGCSSLVLLVPSSVVSGEWNALFNPAHPTAKSIVSTAKAIEFNLDPRLIKKGG
ncbi:RES family NAD+ phosphorylase [Rheinheimera soli]|jgi:RES domain-containing protein|uniref:RES domain-containing protein n=1 Tax=Rheinheimera soli TaxID=443616 RepID=A0ABU1VWJ5_9GAMM|nr:RES family NAD+ phosphorylase [Rheinheimera soli]MDR7120109.1 RES domain-containing protein [Rheinheimera soli]